MSRPRLRRRISQHPKCTYFKPNGIPVRKLKIIELTFEELETLRLKNIENLNQTESAKKMQTSQSTFQRILDSAYKKITLALVNGHAIKICNN